MEKKCGKCKIVKDFSCFYKDKHCKGGLGNTCIECRIKYLEENKVRILEINRKRTNIYREANKDKIRLGYIKHKYGLSSEKYFKLLAEQDGKCAGCNLPFPKSPGVDHDHRTGKVRGLLCGNCNAAIGLAKENTETLKNLIKYLEKYKD